LTNVVGLENQTCLYDYAMTVYSRFSLLFSFCLLTSISLIAQVPNNYVTQQADLPCLNKRFSLRVHIADDVTGPVPFDTAAFREMVEYTNTMFEPICVSFEACEFLTVENYRYASHERNDASEQISIYGDPNRIDIYVPVMDSVPTTCGRATLNGIQMNPTSYVMVVNYCISATGTTLAHELGHYFGLLHTHETSNGDELVDGSNCETAGDGICDTPADPFVLGAPITWTDPMDPCRFVFRGVDANGQFYTPHTANVMSYYPSGCNCGFTYDQLTLMAKNCVEGGGRVW